jgi:hypothetical protein
MKIITYIAAGLWLFRPSIRAGSARKLEQRLRSMSRQDRRRHTKMGQKLSAKDLPIESAAFLTDAEAAKAIKDGLGKRKDYDGLRRRLSADEIKRSSPTCATEK